MLPDRAVWIFVAPGALFPGGVFSTQEHAEEWIRTHRLNGVLTAYPLDEGVLDWLTRIGHAPASVIRKAADPAFVGGFSSALQEHSHYESGERRA